MPEYRRDVPNPSVDEAVARQSDTSQAAFQEFVVGLRMLSTDFDALVANFAWCAGQLAGAEDFPAQMRGMIEFAHAYHQEGLNKALGAIDDQSGVEVDIEIPALRMNRPPSHTPGRIVGLVGARGKRSTKIIEGVAEIGEQFVAVNIWPDGRTAVHRDHVQPGYRLTNRNIEEIFPRMPRP